MARTIGTLPFHGLRFEGRRFDCGSKAGFLEANLAYALERDDLRDTARDIIRRYGAALCSRFPAGERSMRIAMVGTGYVGLVSGACFSEFGPDVVCVAKAAGKIEPLERCGLPVSVRRAGGGEQG